MAAGGGDRVVFGLPQADGADLVPRLSLPPLPLLLILLDAHLVGHLHADVLPEVGPVVSDE